MITVLPAPVVDAETEFARIVAELTRRGFLGGAAGAAALAVAGCSSASGSAPVPAPAAAADWSWTDDRGKKITAATRPKRVAFLTDTVGAALWAAGLRPAAATDSKQGIVEAAGMTMSGIANVYSADKGVDIEALAAAQPDLLIDAVQADGTLQVQSQVPAVAKLAPVVGLSVYRPVEQIAGTADRLTVSLGAALADTAAKARYTAAATRLKNAVKANPGLRTAFVFDIDTSTIGVMNPATWPVLKTVRELGLDVTTVPAGSDNTYSYAMSWENATSIPADLLVWAVSDPLPSNPVWKQVPAVRAGQLWQPGIASWYAYTWANFATLLDGLATHVAAAKTGTGPAGSTAGA